ncbi:spt2 chromatin [Cystoisospora suis]|uniref:Spt2 chromatin n=1 Tax=Cystoisospora suis TaxID=483139 RepID=A0A2C6KNI3_9APIC|nr:spt2 chromatin [Cystoisospora suis]
MAAPGHRHSSGGSRGPGLVYGNCLGNGVHRAFRPSSLLAETEKQLAGGQGLKEGRQRTAEEEQVSSEWRANRLQELRVFLRKANRELNTGPETQKAIKELTLLQENPSMGPPPDVLAKLMKKSSQNGTSNNCAPSSRGSASPSEKPPPDRPLTVSELLQIQLRERGEALLRQREREKQEAQARQEAKSARSKPRPRVKQLSSPLSSRRAAPERRREFSSRSQKKGPMIVGFEESRRKAAAHGIIVRRTLPKPAPGAPVQTSGLRPEDEVVSTGVNGVVKPAKRWVGGKVYVEKRTGTSTVTYNPPGRAVSTKTSPALLKSEEASPVVLKSEKTRSVAMSEDLGGSVSESVSEEGKLSTRPPVCSEASSSSDSDSGSSLSSLSPSPERAVTRPQTPPRTPSIHAKTKGSDMAFRLPCSSSSPQAPASVLRTSPISEGRHSKTSERPRPPSPAFRSAPPGGHRLSPTTFPARQTASASSVSSVGTKQKPTMNAGMNRLTSNSKAPLKCVIPGAKSTSTATIKTSSSSTSRPRHAPVPDLTGASTAPRKYICGVPQPPRRLCVIGNTNSNAPRSFIPAVAAADAASSSSTTDRKRSRDGDIEEEASVEAELPPWRHPGLGTGAAFGSKRFGAAPWRSRIAPQEHDSDMSDFIVDDEEEEPDWRTEMRAVTGYDPSRYAGVVEECEESSFLRQSAEERVSSIVAKQEDDEEYRKILLEEREERRNRKLRRG